jgi:hypothetical protein
MCRKQAQHTKRLCELCQTFEGSKEDEFVKAATPVPETIF